MRENWQKVKTPVTLLILLVILFTGAWWGYQNVIKPIPPLPPEPCVTQTVGENLTSSKVTVRIYNGGTTRGLAADVGSFLREKGFNVIVIDNADIDYETTHVFARVPEEPQAQLVAGFFAGVTVKGDDRIDGTVDVYLGTKYGGLVKDAPVTIAVPDQTVCLPPSETPAETPSETPAETPSEAPAEEATTTES